MMKRKRAFELLDKDMHQLALGICYDEMNVQIHWRHDIGHTAENFSNISYTLFMMEDIEYFRWID